MSFRLLGAGGTEAPRLSLPRPHTSNAEVSGWCTVTVKTARRGAGENTLQLLLDLQMFFGVFCFQNTAHSPSLPRVSIGPAHVLHKK